MATLFEGTCIGKPVNVEFGADKNDRPVVRWQMEVTQGEHKGKRASYSGKLDPDNIKWTKRDMKLIGWKGVSSKTFLDDVKAANVEIEFNAEIASHNDREWTSVKFTGAPLGKLADSKIAEVDKWFAEAEDLGTNGAVSAGNSAPSNYRQGSSDDIPF